MREFTGKSRLRTLSVENRLIYTAYLGFSLMAYIVIAVLVLQRTGLLPGAYAEHYLGNEAEMKFAKTSAELLEVTHFHLFSYPLYLLVQGHLFLMTSWPARLKVSLVLMSFAGCALYLLNPWLVFWWGPGLAWVSLPARVLLGVPLLLFVLVPLVDMWLPVHKKPPSSVQ
jgi:hypothetical protein